MKNRKTKFRFLVFDFYQQDGDSLCGIETKRSPKLLQRVRGDLVPVVKDKLFNIIAKEPEEHKLSITIDFICSLLLPHITAPVL